MRRGPNHRAYPEWLVYTLPEEQLRSPEIQRSVEFLLDTIGNNPQRDWPIGPRGHSLRALALYQKRVFDQSKPPSQEAKGRASSAVAR